MSKWNKRKRIRHAILMIQMEIVKAEDKHPEWPSDIVHAGAIVAEEAGELTQATLECFYEKGARQKCIDEAVQVGAMAVRFLCEMLKDGGE